MGADWVMSAELLFGSQQPVESGIHSRTATQPHGRTAAFHHSRIAAFLPECVKQVQFYKNIPHELVSDFSVLLMGISPAAVIAVISPAECLEFAESFGQHFLHFSPAFGVLGKWWGGGVAGDSGGSDHVGDVVLHAGVGEEV
ncbi:hypothetical protein FRC0126_00674 [Corynebacterium diphtheriae]|nr:hypothetical protein CIP107504_00719 [Corynebacterium diphtheriae]CAB0638642.1 hypothetical protein CIP107576_00717 [Corynebacterium diphtheriae]CAB0638647.1 hypothetical protein CIP107560_00718 [Corynebacterium diphtheriae]CAB0685523.1 hypothetical protein FRC0028_00699 [Corynebacterium diphtheriae]CAB0685642.1 hypothetical protein FRC0081_00698 [Corynebacterium diphtheriae]